ncbi:MAG: hypothetical protein RLZZ206_3977, partial [Cyanobacteriota bacterium]
LMNIAAVWAGQDLEVALLVRNFGRIYGPHC